MDISISSFLFLIVGVLIGYILASIILKSTKAKQADNENEIQRLRQTEAAATQSAIHLEKELSAIKSERDQLRAERNELSISAASLKVEKESLSKQMSKHQEDLVEMKTGFQKEFENLANKIFEEKSEKFASQNKTSLQGIIDPLKERIADFQKKVEESHTSSIKENSNLRLELKNLKDMSQIMSDKAENLTNALKNDSKAQGNWGEMILENILESSGLEKDRTYFIQKSFTNDEGQRLQPDVMIKLPDNKWIVVDSKVSLTAYERYVHENDSAAKDDAYKMHITSMRAHFKSLSGKSYNELSEGKNLDFILMFVPIEPAYLLALHGDQSLFNEAYEKGIVMVSPSTLIASLKIIASTWKHEYQNKNALEIANRGKLLLEKFMGFTEDFSKIGTQLAKADQTYNDALKKLSDGKGSLITQAKQLEDLGVKSKKRIGSNLGIKED